MFESKISDAESIVQALIENKTTSSPENLKDQKMKIFEVCKLIYDEQRIAGSQLKQIELKVQELRTNFSRTMMKTKGYWGSEEEIN